MNSALAHWRIIPDASNEEVAAILARDRVWNSFLLADLEPPIHQYVTGYAQLL